MESKGSLHSITKGKGSTFALDILIPRSHLEDILRSAVEVCQQKTDASLYTDRFGDGNSQHMNCSNMLELLNKGLSIHKA